MTQAITICTCTNAVCPLHPSNHDKGCTPCIAKNLKTREMPNCFFNQLEDADSRNDDSYEAFAKLVLQQT
ncbi:DUF6485 family protein [uncultured Megasphaera sp.]|uniref:DUF6485 family protein n=1 Tax=uncultured Megasphaera sp. TaxID=165188 RepID=UPI00263A1C36|nr:DUF6485 family protein [uncultured Megasphaera sp.]